MLSRDAENTSFIVFVSKVLVYIFVMCLHYYYSGYRGVFDITVYDEVVQLVACYGFPGVLEYHSPVKLLTIA
jgi:hypothetical protein